MKKLITLLTCLTLLGATSILTGCAGTGKNVAYKSLKTVAESVDVGMKAFAEAVLTGAVEPEAQLKVQVLHTQYQLALKKAVTLAQFDYENAAPAEVAGLAAELTSFIAVYVH
jgi:hypothetical protein